MTRNTPLTPLGISALGLLVERPMHPYEMYQVLMQRHEDRIVKVRPGTLYHAVGRLAADGLVEPLGTERDGNRPERTTYAILPAGRDALKSRVEDLLSTPVNEYPCFPQALDAANNLPAAAVIGLMEQRLDHLQAQVTALETGVAQAAANGVEPRLLIDADYQQTLLNAEIKWVGQLCSDIASGALPW
ncbi:PadR family transcriptional regulator [Arthrobacter sp. TWP1-1]|uniref:PadR family transcriptional regulator n=1 Tax=Arthrobacter sp. TWP1-1 TaxID=2804568 RepID=UPI003CF13F59